MTHSLVLDAIARSDLLMRERYRRANTLETEPFVSGSVLRGALAAVWLRVHGDGPPFRDVFLGGSVEFVGGYPVEAPPWGGEMTSLMSPPTTLRRLKIADADRDALDVSFEGTPDDLPPTRGVSEFVGLDEKAGRAWRSAMSFLRTRHRIGTRGDGSGRADKTPDQGKLFSETVINGGTRFRLRIDGPEKLLDGIVNLLKDDSVGNRISVGRSRTVMGLLEVTDRRMVDIAEDPPVKGRRHALLFLTDAVLLDGHHRFRMPDEAWLADLANAKPADFTVEMLHLRAGVAAGWSAIHGGPKPFDPVVERGSVIVFSSDDQAAKAVARRLTQGVGWRRLEGYGRIALDHPIHRATWPARTETHDATGGDEGRLAIAEAADRLAEKLGKGRLRVGYSDWAPLMQVATLEPDRRPQRAEAVRSQSPQARTAQGFGAGERVRELEARALKEFDAAASTLGLDADGRGLLAQDVERELRLRGKVVG